MLCTGSTQKNNLTWQKIVDWDLKHPFKQANVVTVTVSLCMLGNFAILLSSADSFDTLKFRKILSGISSECHKVTLSVSDCLQKVLAGKDLTCCRLLTLVKIKFFKKFFQEHCQSVKQFGSRSGPTFCRS